MQISGGKKQAEGKRIRRGALSMMTRPESPTGGQVTQAVGPEHFSPRRVQSGDALAIAVGKEIRNLRLSLNMAANQLADIAGLSNGMLSKIERGSTTPSFGTLTALSHALKVPVARLFASHDQRSDYSLVRAGKGICVQRRGSKVGLTYELLGHLLSGEKYVEPYLVTLASNSNTSPGFQHTGIEFMYILDGSMVFRYADSVVELRKGDALVFDANSIHGHEQLLTTPVRYLSVVFNLRS